MAESRWFHKMLDAKIWFRLGFPMKDGQAELGAVVNVSGAKQNAPDSFESWDVC